MHRFFVTSARRENLFTFHLPGLAAGVCDLFEENLFKVDNGFMDKTIRGLLNFRVEQ